MKQVKTLQGIGQYRTGVTVDVLTDDEVAKLVKDGKPVEGLTESRVAELIEMGAVEEVEEKPTAKTTTKTTSAKASITGADLKPYAETTE